jgi:hypothetical protein
LVGLAARRSVVLENQEAFGLGGLAEFDVFHAIDVLRDEDDIARMKVRPIDRAAKKTVLDDQEIPGFVPFVFLFVLVIVIVVDIDFIAPGWHLS